MDPEKVNNHNSTDEEALRNLTEEIAKDEAPLL